MLVASYQSMLKFQNRLAPLQDKMLKFMSREIEDMDESDRWKLDDDEENEEKNT